MNWIAHSKHRWVSSCGHYARSVVHGVAGSVYDAWFHSGLPDFEHVGYSSDPAQLDRIVHFHAAYKLESAPSSHEPISPSPTEESL